MYNRFFFKLLSLFMRLLYIYHIAIFTALRKKIIQLHSPKNIKFICIYNYYSLNYVLMFIIIFFFAHTKLVFNLIHFYSMFNNFILQYFVRGSMNTEPIIFNLHNISHFSFNKRL